MSIFDPNRTNIHTEYLDVIPNYVLLLDGSPNNFNWTIEVEIIGCGNWTGGQRVKCPGYSVLPELGWSLNIENNGSKGRRVFVWYWPIHIKFDFFHIFHTFYENISSNKPRCYLKISFLIQMLSYLVLYLLRICLIDILLSWNKIICSIKQQIFRRYLTVYCE